MLEEEAALDLTVEEQFFRYPAFRPQADMKQDVNDNHSLGQEQRLVNLTYGGAHRGQAHTLWMSKETTFAKIAAGMGCVGIRVEKPGQFRASVEQAFPVAAPRSLTLEAITRSCTRGRSEQKFIESSLCSFAMLPDEHEPPPRDLRLARPISMLHS